MSIKAMSDAAHRFEVLRDRFRQASLIGATKRTEELEEEFKQLMDQLDDARAASLAVPERHFKKAQRKVGTEHYDFDVTAEFFEATARDKLPTAPLLSRSDGKAWNKDAWKWPIKATAETAA